jgi:hypothetical protein
VCTCAAERDGRPERMYRNGRPIDQDFSLTESLYWRCPESKIENGHVALDGMRFPDISVNRGRYSEPEDVLIPDCLDFRIATFMVQDIPSPLISESQQQHRFEFRPEHDPCECNYAHSEIRTYKQDVRQLKGKLPENIKLRFRLLLSRKTRVLPAVPATNQ